MGGEDERKRKGEKRKEENYIEKERVREEGKRSS